MGLRPWIAGASADVDDVLVWEGLCKEEGGIKPLVAGAWGSFRERSSFVVKLELHTFSEVTDSYTELVSSNADYGYIGDDWVIVGMGRWTSVAVGTGSAEAVKGTSKKLAAAAYLRGLMPE